MAVNTNTFFQYIDDFMDYRKTIHELSDQTMKSNHIDLNIFKTFVTDHKFDVINGDVAIKFQYYLKDIRENSGGSINRKIFALRIYSQFLNSSDVVNADKLPFRNILKIRQGYNNRPGALTHDQIKHLFENIDRSNALGIRDYTVYGFMYNLGLRIGEVHSLNLENIDLKRKEITVIGKGGRQRALSMTRETIQILLEWLAVRKQFRNSDSEEVLFLSKKGNRLAIRTMQDNFKKLVKKAGLKTHFNITCHILRHSFASHLNDKGTDILVLKSILGHSSTRSTQIYIHPSAQKVREEMEKLPSVVYLNQLIESGEFPLSFQGHSKAKRA